MTHSNIILQARASGSVHHPPPPLWGRGGAGPEAQVAAAAGGCRDVQQRLWQLRQLRAGALRCSQARCWLAGAAPVAVGAWAYSMPSFLVLGPAVPHALKPCAQALPHSPVAQPTPAHPCTSLPSPALPRPCPPRSSPRRCCRPGGARRSRSSWPPATRSAGWAAPRTTTGPPARAAPPAPSRCGAGTLVSANKHPNSWDGRWKLGWVGLGLDGD